MYKIVGKHLVYFLGLAFFMVDASIRMEIRTNGSGTVDGKIIVGQELNFDVIVDGISGSASTPTINGLDNFVARRTGMYMSSINGKTTTRYSYLVRIDKIGSYTIGPAAVMHGNHELLSNKINIDVVKDIVESAQQQVNTHGTESKAFLRLMIDRSSVVVGQKIGCTLRFYYQDPSLSLHNIGMPEFPDFDMQEVGKLESGTAEINGSQYRYAQWRWDMYPTKAGEFIIPAYHADYDTPTKDNHMLAGLFMFVNNRVDRKRVYSNAVTITVSSLPCCDHEVQAVGIFERISAEILPGVAKEGEGMILTIEIEGEGNLQNIKTPLLKLPESLKYYDSNNTIIAPRCSDELPKKRFEFIVQGMQCGDYEIPVQRFTFFDIEKNIYTTLCTSPLAVSIMPGSCITKKEITNPIDNFTNETTSLESLHEDSIADINTAGKWYPAAKRQPLPWWLFQLLFFIPFFYSIYLLTYKRFIALRYIIRRNAFQKIRKQINQSREMRDDKKLYSYFITFFKQLNEIYEIDTIENFLRIRGVPESQISLWNDFFESIIHAAYMQSDKENTDILCGIAQKWIDYLEKVI
ncbi:MAG TPA: BatD family protein [Candidatus Babeliales bacterium]|nr:BatD family protein [Candidatus Babeliales bacterium]